MLYNTEAIVIRSIVYGETHAIVTLLTPGGKVAAMARGAKKPQSRLAAGVQVCVEGVYSLYQGKGMGTISQLEVVRMRRPLREHLDKAAYAAYFCELVQAAAEERPNGSEAVYRLFKGALDRLTEAADEDIPLVARVWEAKALRMLGASPDWRYCVRCGQPLLETSEDDVYYASHEGGLVCNRCRTATAAIGIRVPKNLARVLDAMSRVPWDRLGEIRLSEPSRRVLRSILRAQLTEYAGLSLKSLQFIDSLSGLSP